MDPGTVWRFLLRRVRREHRGLRAFDNALREAGGPGSRVDRGVITVPTASIVGSVDRWRMLRSDFFYRTGQAMTRRFYRIGEAMEAGKLLPPLELYKLQRRSAEPSEYYVVDGHHRVAMARRLGQDFLDAHVIEYVGHDVQLAHRLRRVQLFRDAPADDLVALWRHLTEQRVSAGSVVCRRGEEGDRLYMVQTGSLEVRLGVGPNSTPLNRLYAGDCFGEMSLLTGEPRSADVVATEDAVLWTLNRSDFERILTQSVPLLRALTGLLAQRVSIATTVIEQTRVEAAASSDPTGLKFGPYRVVAQLGAGGMAVVYQAVREDDGTAVALKVLPASWGAAAELRARLDREADILRRVQHPGVIRLLDIGPVAERLGGGTYLAMEWLPDALDRVLCAQLPQPLASSDALRIAGAVADALAVVHVAGLVHRDVKPSNILLRATGQPVLTDFGLAAALVDILGERRLTPPNVFIGTADYLAPEVITDRAVDGRADLYALGVVLYEMLTGFVPFAGRDPYQTLRAHCEEPIPPLPEDIPLPVRTIVERALQKDPQARFATAREMAAHIAAVSS